jgi:hypothetical protein
LDLALDAPDDEWYRLALDKVGKIVRFGTDKLKHALYSHYKRELALITSAARATGGTIDLDIYTSVEDTCELAIKLHLTLTRPFKLK